MAQWRTQRDDDTALADERIAAEEDDANSNAGGGAEQGVRAYPWQALRTVILHLARGDVSVERLLAAATVERDVEHYARALELLRKAFRKDKTCRACLLLASKIYARLGNFPQALRVVKKASVEEYDALAVELLLQRGYAFANQADDRLSDARAMFEAAYMKEGMLAYRDCRESEGCEDDGGAGLTAAHLALAAIAAHSGVDYDLDTVRALIGDSAVDCEAWLGVRHGAVFAVEAAVMQQLASCEAARLQRALARWSLPPQVTTAGGTRVRVGYIGRRVR